MFRRRSTVLYYALGGGWGHAVRALAIARHAKQRHDGRHLVMVNTPFAAALEHEAAQQGIELIQLPADVTPTAAQQHWLYLHDRCRPQTWVIDTFPRGLGGELVWPLQQSCRPRTVLIHRYLCRPYVRAKRLAEFIHRFVDLAIIPGEPSPTALQIPAVPVPPILIRSRHEMWPREVSRDRCQLEPNRPAVLWVLSGSMAEISQGLQQAARIRVPLERAGWQLRLGIPPASCATGLGMHSLALRAGAACRGLVWDESDGMHSLALRAGAACRGLVWDESDGMHSLALRAGAACRGLVWDESDGVHSLALRAGAACRGLVWDESDGMHSLAIRYFPLAEWFLGFDLIIGSAGYNLTHEVRAAGVPAILPAVQRLYDRQRLRANYPEWPDDTELVDSITRQYGQPLRPGACDGAPLAADLIMGAAAWNAAS